MSAELMGAIGLLIGIAMWAGAFILVVLSMAGWLWRDHCRRQTRDALDDVQARERVRPIASGVHVQRRPAQLVRNWDDGGLRAVRREMDQRLRGDL
jgi:uncharacterized membrane protein YhiD involved in acid resistance